MSHIMAPLSDAAVTAFAETTGVPVETARLGLLAALPYLTADLLRHTANQFDRVFEMVGHGGGPEFVLSSMRYGADVVDPRVPEEDWS